MKKTAHSLWLVLFAVLGLAPNVLRAQPVHIVGTLDSLQSEVLGERRVFQVLLPEGYRPGSGEKYDVLYVLDAEWYTKVVTDVLHFVRAQGFMPPVIVVGLHNAFTYRAEHKINFNTRDRDFLPTKSERFPVSGGSDKFLEFLEGELLPYINKTYPTSGNNTLYGHSFGGTFCLYALLTRPGLFSSYMAADPAWWWDQYGLHKLAGEKLAGLAGQNRLFWFTATEGSVKGMGIDTVAALLREKAPGDLHWKHAVYPDETHVSVQLKTVYDGLRYLYRGYNTRIEFHPMNGTVLQDKPFKVMGLPADKDMRYTTDGTEPTAASGKVAGPLTLPGPAILKVKSITGGGRFDKVVTGQFKAGKVPPAADLPKKATPGGLRYAYYPGRWDALPDFQKLKPAQSGRMDQDFSLDKLPAGDPFALLAEGYLRVEEEGYHVFALRAGDLARLYIGGQLVIDNGTAADKNKVHSYLLPLRKGYYPVRVEYRQKDGDRALNLFYAPPGDENGRLIPWDRQYSRP